MSPRSEGFLAEAHDRLAAARSALTSGFPPAAISLGYYAMLYAARAALSEEDRYAKTHSGTWRLFGHVFVRERRFDPDLYRAARDVLPLRIGTDYEAQPVSHAQAQEVVELAERFLEAIEALYPD